MNNSFIFKTNLNDIFTSDEIRNSESTCDYCAKRKRICKCDTIRKEVGSDKLKELEELETLRKSYDEICEKIASRYSDVIARFEYDKDLVRFVKKYKINNEIENEEWFYLYELLKDRNIIERFLEVNNKRGRHGVKGEERVLLNSFHFDEEANFVSCLNYYLKVNGFKNTLHSWMGMSENPFEEFEAAKLNLHNIDNKKQNGKTQTADTEDFEKEEETEDVDYDERKEEVKGEDEAELQRTQSFSDYNGSVGEKESTGNTKTSNSMPNKDQAKKKKTFFSLYYNLYIQENEKWISGLDNSGNLILHPENIDYVWNKTVREGNRIKLFHLITANSVKGDVNDYYKFEKNKEKNYTNNSIDAMETNTTNTTVENVQRNSNNVEPFVIDAFLCLSHIVCGLGMLDVGGFFIIKTKIYFDNLFLSIFSILSICFKNLEIYRPSCCYTKNIVFLIGTEFNGISSIFLSTLTSWIKATQREILLLFKSTSQGDKKNGSFKVQKYYTTRSVIPKRWIRSMFFQEYKNCIKYFIDYLIYHLKNCISISNIHLNRAKIEDTKNYYISQFFEKNKIVDLDNKDKLLSDVLDMYQDKELVNRKYLVDITDDIITNEPGEESNSSYFETTYNTKKSADIKKEFLKIKDIEAFFSNTIEMSKDSKINWKRYTTEVIRLLKRMQCKREKKKNNVAVTNGILNPNEIRGIEEESFFQIDTAILQKRIFEFPQKNSTYLKQEEKFISVLQHQKYFSIKSWFRSVLSKNPSTFKKSFFLKKSIYTDILKCRNYLYYKKCHVYVNSIKQLLRNYEPIRTSYIPWNLNSQSIGLLFVFRNCMHVDIFNDTKILENFVIISRERYLYNFLSEFGNGIHVTLMLATGSTLLLESSSLPNSNSDISSVKTESNGTIFVNVEELYRKGKTYKHFSELLISHLGQKNVCSFIYIDLNDFFPNYVHIVQKELKGKTLFVASLIIALNYLKKNGMMILRLSSILTFFSAGLIYVLLCAFENVQFFLSPSCDDIELDFYISCTNFNANFIYRHYVQYIWDFMTCNKFMDTRHSGNVDAGSRKSKRNEKKHCDLYFSVPLPFIMNKTFVTFLKKFNSFFFKHHINACLNFLKQPKIFHGNKLLGKYIIAHFFKAFIFKHKSYRTIYKSLSLLGGLPSTLEDCSNDLEDKELESVEVESESENEDDEDEEEEEEGEEETNDEKVKKEKKKKNEDVTFRDMHYNKQMFLRGSDKLIENRKRKWEFSSSESNYSISYEFENVPSEISVSDSAWQSD